jgi:hypothetical protein
MTQNKAKKDSNFLDPEITELETKTKRSSCAQRAKGIDNSRYSLYDEAFEGFMKFTENENKTVDLEVTHEFSDAELFDSASPNPKLDALSVLTNYFFTEISDYPDDPENLLSSIDDCLNLLNSLEILGELIPELYHSTINFCIKCKNNSSNTNKTRLDLQFNLCKLRTLSAIQRLVEIINKTAVSEGMSYEKYSLVLHSLSPSTVLIDPISNDNLQHILNRIKKVFPELILPSFEPKKLATKLFQNSNLTINSSSRIMDIFFCFCVSKNLSLKEIANISKVSQTYSKIYKETEKLDLVFREIEATLIKDYGIETYNVFSLLVCYRRDNEDKIINDKITVLAKDLLSYLRKKYNLYRENNLVKRSKLEDNFSWLANQLDLLTIPRLICPRIVPSGKGKEDFELKNTALVEIETSYKPNKDGVIDLTNIPDMEITFSIPWFNYFNNKKYLYEYGYTHKEAFSSSEVKSALLNWLSFKLEHNQDGDFKIRTIIEQIGLKNKLEAIYSETDSKKRRNLEQDLYRIVTSVLKEITEIPDPYQWEYKNPPQWLIDEALKKPRGWFRDTWLDVVIIIKHPKCLITEGKDFRREKVIEITPEPKQNKLTVTDFKSALAQYSNNKNVSLRKLAEAYGTSQPTLSRKLKSGKFTQFELRDLIKWTHILGKKKK